METWAFFIALAVVDSIKYSICLCRVLPAWYSSSPNTMQLVNFGGYHYGEPSQATECNARLARKTQREVDFRRGNDWSQQRQNLRYTVVHPLCSRQGAAHYMVSGCRSSNGADQISSDPDHHITQHPGLATRAL